MKRLLTILSTAAFGVAALASCSNDPTVTSIGTNTTGNNILFKEVDRIGKPGIKELYIPFSTHATYNGTSPQSDGANFAPTIAGFVTGSPANRSAAIGTYVSALLVPDALIGDLGSSATYASYLGWETGGQIAVDCTGLPGTTFGGRSLQDDVVNAMLGLAFGNLATSSTLHNPTPNVVSPTGTGSPTPLAPPPDDGAEKNGANGTPNLTNQDVSCANKGLTPATFPYLGEPL